MSGMVLPGELVAALEEMIIATRTQDMVEITKSYIKNILRIARVSGLREKETTAPSEKAEILRDLADRLMKSSMGYAPLVNSGMVLRRAASRIESGDPIFAEESLSRILMCVVEVFDKFLSMASKRAAEKCSSISADNIAVHSWGSLTLSCAERVAEQNSKAVFAVFGPGAKKLASSLSKQGIQATAVPPLYAYQLARSADIILFQPETITPMSAAARLGVAPVLEYPDSREGVEAIGVTISLAYSPRRGFLEQSYEKLPHMAYRLSWHEILEIPLFDVIYLSNLGVPVRIIDEEGEAKPRPQELRKKAHQILEQLENLVEARCRVFEPSP